MGTTMSSESATTRGAVRYLWLRDYRNRPVACVASEKDGGTVRFALAIHNPKDKFDKKMGRAVALARLRGNKHARFVSRINEVGISVKNVKKELLSILSSGAIYRHAMGAHELIPERVREAAKYRLDNYKEPEQIVRGSVERRLAELRSEGFETQPIKEESA